MRKTLLYWLLAMILLGLAGCGTWPQSPSAAPSAPAPSLTPSAAPFFTPSVLPSASPTASPSPSPTPTVAPFLPGVIADYLPFEPFLLTYVDADGQHLECILEYIDHDAARLQKKWVQSSEIEVFALTPDEMILQYSRAAAFTHNFCATAESPAVLLKQPLALGNEWEAGSGTIAITGMGQRLNLPSGVFDTVQTTATQPDGSVIRRYYAKGIGLVKQETGLHNEGAFVQFGGFELKSIEQAEQFIASIPLHFAQPRTGRILSLQTQIPVPVNANMREILATLLKNPPADGCLAFPSGAQIRAFTLGRNQITVDLSSRFVESLEIGLRGEKLLLQALANTFAAYFQVETVRFTVEREPYISAALMLSPEDRFAPVDALPYAPLD